MAIVLINDVHKISADDCVEWIFFYLGIEQVKIEELVIDVNPTRTLKEPVFVRIVTLFIYKFDSARLLIQPSLNINRLLQTSNKDIRIKYARSNGSGKFFLI